MKRMLHPALQKLSALAMLGIALGLASSAIAYPLVEAYSAQTDAISRLEKYRGMLSSKTNAGVVYDPAELVAAYANDADAQLALQAAIDRLARTSHVSVQSIEPMAAEHLGELGRGVWVEMAFSSDIQALLQFLSSLETESPMLLIRRLEVDGGDGLRPDIALRVRAQLGRAWRVSKAPA